MPDETKCVLGAINKTKISNHEGRIKSLEKLVFWLFSTSIGTLLTALILLAKELLN